MEVLGNRIHIDTDIYIWGIYCAVGAVCALAAIGIYCGSRKMKKGAAPLLGLCAMVLGFLFSRIVYCAVVTLTEKRMPFSTWFRTTEGGWTMFGMIGGAMLAGWISAMIIREKPARMLDAVSLALPLMVAAERLGEGRLDELFNYNQFLSAGKLGKGFFTVADETGAYLIATYRVDMVLCIVLFLALTFSMLSSRRRDGDLWIRFMTLCGAGGVLGESLRADGFLVYSFVRIEQVLSAMLLFAGIIAAGKQAGRSGRKLFWIAVVTMVLTIAECVGIEFVMDRTKMNRWVMTAVMAAALSIPVIQVEFLQRMGGETETPRETGGSDTGKAVWIAAVVSLTETVFIASEILKIGISLIFPFPFIVLISAVLIAAFHLVILFRSGWGNFLRLNRSAKEN